MNSTVIIIGLIGIAAFSALRIVSQWRGLSRKRGPIDWDEHFIQQLRKAGISSFEEQAVDFFFTVREKAASDQLADVLRGDGYAVDIKQNADGGDFSLHAQRNLRLVVGEMQTLRARFNNLAAQHGASYDNWAVGVKK